MMNGDCIITSFDFKLIDSNFKDYWKYRNVTKGDTLIILREMDSSQLAAPELILDDAVVWATCSAATAVACCNSRIAEQARYAITPDTARASRVRVHATARAAGNVYDKLYVRAGDELKKTGMIKGFELLNPRTLDKLWISHYDMKVLYRLNAQQQ